MKTKFSFAWWSVAWPLFLICAICTSATTFADSTSKKPGSSSSSSSGGSSSKKPSSGSSMFGSSSGGSTSKRPSDAGAPRGDKPMFGSTNPSKPAEEKPSKPMFGSTNPTKVTPPSATVNSRPSNSPPSATVGGSNRPTGDVSAKARANMQDASSKKYDAAHPQVAKTPPPPPHVQKYQYKSPEQHRQSTNIYITQNHYRHDYDWYYHQPTVYIGPGYSSAFWYMMMEWDAERRAQWFYNHQNDISRDAYLRGVSDAAVAQRIAELQAQRAPQNPQYIDPSLRDNPGVMYDVAPEAIPVDNTVVVAPPSGGSGGLTVFLWILGILVGIGILYALLNLVRVGR